MTPVSLFSLLTLQLKIFLDPSKPYLCKDLGSWVGSRKCIKLAFQGHVLWLCPSPLYIGSSFCYGSNFMSPHSTSGQLLIALWRHSCQYLYRIVTDLLPSKAAHARRTGTSVGTHHGWNTVDDMNSALP